MNLPEDELRKYYEGVAQDLIKDGVTGWTTDELVEKLMSDPDNPFRLRSKEEIMHDLEISEQQIKEGKYKTAEEVFAELEKELKNGGKS